MDTLPEAQGPPPILTSKLPRFSLWSSLKISLSPPQLPPPAPGIPSLKTHPPPTFFLFFCNPAPKYLLCQHVQKACTKKHHLLLLPTTSLSLIRSSWQKNAALSGDPSRCQPFIGFFNSTIWFTEGQLRGDTWLLESPPPAKKKISGAKE